MRCFYCGAAIEERRNIQILSSIAAHSSTAAPAIEEAAPQLKRFYTVPKMSKPGCVQLNRKLHCDQQQQQQQQQQEKRKTKTIAHPKQNHEYFDSKYFKRYSKVKKETSFCSIFRRNLQLLVNFFGVQKS